MHVLIVIGQMFITTSRYDKEGKFLSIYSTWYNVQNWQDVSAQIGPSWVAQTRTWLISCQAPFNCYPLNTQWILILHFSSVHHKLLEHCTLPPLLPLLLPYKQSSCGCNQQDPDMVAIKNVMVWLVHTIISYFQTRKVTITVGSTFELQLTQERLGT